jgi:hypothetical protein
MPSHAYHRACALSSIAAVATAALLAARAANTFSLSDTGHLDRTSHCGFL